MACVPSYKAPGTLNAARAYSGRWGGVGLVTFGPSNT